MFRILFVLVVMLAAAPVCAATCDAGYYLLNDACTVCPTASYCPGDDAVHSCKKLFTGQSGVTLISEDTTINDPTSGDNCVCHFFVNTPNDESATRQFWRGKCSDGPTEYRGILLSNCRAGYYPSQYVSNSYLGHIYQECTPCTNATIENTIYTGYGTPNANDCPWACADGWRISSDGTVCDKLCTLGFTTLNTSTGVTVPLYAEKRTTPSINIGDVNGACHADLAPGRATGAINIMYNGEIYHTIAPTTEIQCDAGRYLKDDTTCVACGEKYYCPGDNSRISCEEAIPDEDKDVQHTIYEWTHNSEKTQPEQCLCTWYLSDERRATYCMVTACYQGVPEPGSDTEYLLYHNCRVGYYAIGPKNYNNWYSDCAACTNGPANSHYTSYSTPSVIYAVESNCPWECDDGYVRDGDICVAE